MHFIDAYLLGKATIPLLFGRSRIVFTCHWTVIDASADLHEIWDTQPTQANNVLYEILCVGSFYPLSIPTCKYLSLWKLKF